MTRVPSEELPWHRDGDPQPGACYRHAATGGEYMVISVALDANTLRRVVVYQELGTRHIWTREVVEFTDGRFELVPTEAP